MESHVFCISYLDKLKFLSLCCQGAEGTHVISAFDDNLSVKTRFCQLTIHSPYSSSLQDASDFFLPPTLSWKGKSNACPRESKTHVGLLQTSIYGASRIWFQWSVPSHSSLLSPSHCPPNHSSQSLKKYHLCFLHRELILQEGWRVCTIFFNHECGGHGRIKKNITLLNKEEPTLLAANWEVHSS